MLPLNCPHCHGPIPRDDERTEVMVCPGCGSSFRLGDELAETTAHEPQKLGKFELLERVGVGAFGAVWKARDLELGRIVAVKTLLPSLLEAKANRERFFREARAAAQLRHPGIVPVHEVVELEGTPAIVADFVEGVTLRELLQVRRLTFREAAVVVAQVADALDYAHAMKLVHRDVKPANIMVELTAGQALGMTLDGDPAGSTWPPASSGSISSSVSSRPPGPRVLLLDFGLALRDEAEVRLTADGQIIGTPAYMSPEQAAGQGHKVDRRSDVYSLGVVLYELLTGEVPFRGSKIALVHQVLNDDPRPPRTVNHAVPRDLETICLKAMARHMPHRYATARQLADDVRRFLKREVILARPAGPAERLWRWCGRNPLVASLTTAIASLLVVVAVGATTSAVRLSESAHVANGLRAKAEAAQRDALQRAAESRDLLVQQYVANGVRLLEEGDAVSALPWFVEAARQDIVERDRETVHRVRFATVLRRCPKLVQVFFHGGAVARAHFSPDGRRVLTASNDGTARLWEVRTGGPVGSPFTHGARVRRAAFSPDGSRVVTASYDGTARVWDAETGQSLTPPLQHRDAVTHAVFSPEGGRVLTASNDHTACVWNATTGALISGPFTHKGEVSHAAFSPDGRLVATACNDGSAFLLEAASGKPTIPPLAHGSQLNGVWFSPDGARIFTASNDYNLRIWDTRTGQMLRQVRHEAQVGFAGLSSDGKRLFTLCGDSVHLLDGLSGERIAPVLRHADRVHTAEFNADGRQLVTSCEDGKVRIWDTTTGRRVSALLPHGTNVYHTSFSPDGRQVVSASADGSVRVWDLAAAEGASPTLRHDSQVMWASFSPDGRRIVTASSDRTARIWDTKTGEPLTRPLIHEYGLHMASFSPDGRLILSAAGDGDGKPEKTSGSAALWDATTGERFRLLGHGADVQCANFSSDGQRVVTAGWDGFARVWDVVSGDEVLQLNKHDRRIYFATFSPDGQRIVTAGFDGTVRIWDATTGAAIASPLRSDGPCLFFRATFSLDGRLLLTTASNEETGVATTQVWDTSTGQAASAGIRHAGPYSLFAAFRPDARRFVAAAGGTARIYDVERATGIGQPMKHVGMVGVSQFSPNGSLVLTASWDHTARLWDAHSGTPVSPHYRHEKEIWYAEFSTDGHHLVTASADNTARVWNITPDARTIDDLSDLTKLLSGQCLSEAGTLESLDATSLKSLWARLRSRFPGEFAVTPEEVLGWRRLRKEAPGPASHKDGGN